MIFKKLQIKIKTFTNVNAYAVNIKTVIITNINVNAYAVNIKKQ